MKRLNGLDILVLVVVIIGAINWGLIGLFNYDVLAAIFGSMSGVTRVLYSIVGLSGLYLAFASPMFGRLRMEAPDHMREHPVA